MGGGEHRGCTCCDDLKGCPADAAAFSQKVVWKVMMELHWHPTPTCLAHPPRPESPSLDPGDLLSLEQLFRQLPHPAACKHEHLVNHGRIKPSVWLNKSLHAPSSNWDLRVWQYSGRLQKCKVARPSAAGPAVASSKCLDTKEYCHVSRSQPCCFRNSQTIVCMPYIGECPTSCEESCKCEVCLMLGHMEFPCSHDAQIVLLHLLSDNCIVAGLCVHAPPAVELPFSIACAAHAVSELAIA